MGRVKNIIKNLTFYLASALFLYEISLGIANYLIVQNSQKIRFISHLERLIEEKKKEASFNKNIRVEIDYPGKITTTALSRKKGVDSYEIVINKDWLNTKTLDHELNHIFDGHCESTSTFKQKNLLDKLVEKWKFYYYEEPKTIIHTLMNK